MPEGLFSNMKPARRRKRRALTPEEQALAERQGITPDELLLDREEWQGAPPHQDATATSALLSDDDLTDNSGLLTDVKPQKKKGGAKWYDYVGLAGATLSEMGGRDGSINSFMDRYKGRMDEQEWEDVIGGLGIDDPFEAELAKTDKAGYLAARFGDKKENERYARGRTDTLSDVKQQRGYDVEDRDLTLGETRAARETQQSQFDSTLSQDDRQFWAQLKQQMTDKAAERAAKYSGEAVFEGPQLATIYNKNLEYLDEQETALKDLEDAAAESAAFQATARDFGSIGSSTGDAFGRFWSGITGGKIKELERHTKAVAAKMRAGSKGIWTDADQMNAEAYVVNAENPRAANEYAAKLATALAARKREQVSLLREAIDPRDPTSRQTVQAYWDAYVTANPLFDPRTKQPLDPASLLTFDQWFDAQVGMIENERPGAGGGGAPAPTADQSAAAADELLKNIKANPAAFRQEIEEFDRDFGQPGAARQLIEQRLGKAAADAMFGR
jgi:hypothetical protein